VAGVTEPAESPKCRECQQPLLLVRPGRELCARCEVAAGGDPFVRLDAVSGGGGEGAGAP